ncbi:MAG: MBL fold metallo-hydrolase [Spirochaetales bacterium]|nr:MBL fold metallo-hydrolase [Spirochaetales bacterium]
MKMSNLHGNTCYLETRNAGLGLYHLNDKDVILLDTGLKETAEKELIPFFQENRFNLKGILCTHFHYDHSGGIPSLKKVYKPEVVFHYTENILTESSYNMYWISYSQKFKSYDLTLPEYKYYADHVIGDDQEVFSFFDQEFKILHTHGHSPYHISYITPDNVAYIGDTILGDKILDKTKLPYSFNIADDLKAKEMLRKIDCEKYILSHGGVYENIDTLIEKNIDNTLSKIELLLDFLKEPLSFDGFIASIAREFNVSEDISKIDYLQRCGRAYVAYFQDEKFVETIVKDHQICFRKV